MIPPKPIGLGLPALKECLQRESVMCISRSIEQNIEDWMNSHVESMPHQSGRGPHTKTAKTFMKLNVELQPENECGDSREFRQLSESIAVGREIPDRYT